MLRRKKLRNALLHPVLRFVSVSEAQEGFLHCSEASFRLIVKGSRHNVVYLSDMIARGVRCWVVLINSRSRTAYGGELRDNCPQRCVSYGQ